jgi:hypothetical protein
MAASRVVGRRFPAVFLASVAALAFTAWTVSPAANADLGAPSGTTAQSRDHSVSTPPVPVVTAITTARHADFDRVVVQFSGAMPSWRVAYGSVPRGQSGQSMALAGSADLRVDLRPAQAHDAAGNSTVSRDQHPGLPTVREVAVADDFEGVVVLGLGLSSRVGFRVSELTGPNRLVVDVAHVAAAQPATPVRGTASFTG